VRPSGAGDIQAFTIWMSNLLCAVSAAFSLAHVGVASVVMIYGSFFILWEGGGLARYTAALRRCGVLYKVALEVGDFACAWRDGTLDFA
jgi:hypothetical protein